MHISHDHISHPWPWFTNKYPSNELPTQECLLMIFLLSYPNQFLNPPKWSYVQGQCIISIFTLPGPMPCSNKLFRRRLPIRSQPWRLSGASCRISWTMTKPLWFNVSHADQGVCHIINKYDCGLRTTIIAWHDIKQIFGYLWCVIHIIDSGFIPVELMKIVQWILWLMHYFPGFCMHDAQYNFGLYIIDPLIWDIIWGLLDDTHTTWSIIEVMNECVELIIIILINHKGHMMLPNS